MSITAKPVAMAGRGVAYAMSALSKNALIDFALDMAVRAIGEDQATDENILKWIEDAVEPVCRFRGDKTPKLLARLEAIRANDRRHLEARVQ